MIQGKFTKVKTRGGEIIYPTTSFNLSDGPNEQYIILIPTGEPGDLEGISIGTVIDDNGKVTITAVPYISKEAIVNPVTFEGMATFSQDINVFLILFPLYSPVANFTVLVDYGYNSSMLELYAMKVAPNERYSSMMASTRSLSNVPYSVLGINSTKVPFCSSVALTSFPTSIPSLKSKVKLRPSW